MLYLAWVVWIEPLATSLKRWLTDLTEVALSFVYGQTNLSGSSIIGIGIRILDSVSEFVTHCQLGPPPIACPGQSEC